MSSRVGAIVLAGGGSERMGSAKASLEWHGSTLLRRVAGILERAVDGPVVVVRAPGQELPPLPVGVEVVEDRDVARGPLEGLACGLAALDGRTRTAFVSATDAPLLHPALIAAVVGGLGAADDICVPVLNGRPHPLAAAYRVELAGAIDALLRDDRLRLGLLLEGRPVRRLEADELLADPLVAAADPRLESLANLNRPEDYAAARARPGPAISVRCLREDGRPGGVGGMLVAARAATLAGAAAAAGVRLGGGVVSSLNGEPCGEDPELPLVSGDAVAFIVR